MKAIEVLREYTKYLKECPPNGEKSTNEIVENSSENLEVVKKKPL